MGWRSCYRQGLSKVRHVQLLPRTNLASTPSQPPFRMICGCYRIRSGLHVDSHTWLRERSSTVFCQKVQKLHSCSSQNSNAPSEADVEQAIADITVMLDRKSKSVPEIWAKYDQLKIRRMLSFLPYEAWVDLLKTCQRDPLHITEPLRRHLRERQASDISINSQTATGGQVGSSYDGHVSRLRHPPLFPLQQSGTIRLQSLFAKEFVGTEQFVWTRHISKRRALMFLSDMWRYSGTMQPVDSHGRLVVDKAPEPDKEGILRRSDNYSSWRPSEYHYNIVLDAINHDPASKIDEMLQLHRDMKARGIREDAVTFNTILNGCRRLRDWASFVDVKNQMIERDRCGITRMDAHSWSTLIQGYKELKDWVSVDRYITQATSACHEWFTAQEERRAEDQGIRPTVQLWCTIISTYVDRNMVPQMLAARRIMSGLGLRASTYVFGPIFAALHKARQIAVRKGRDVTPVQRLALSEYEAMQDEGVEPNEVILTNLMLTIGYSRQGQNSAANCDDEKCISGENQKLTTVFRLISQKLESILVQTHNPQIYAALIGIAGRARQLEAVQYFWRTLIDEARLPRAEYGKERPHLLNSLTLGSYLSALINCKRYNDAVVAFLEYAFYKKTDHSHKAHMRSISSSLKLQSINRDVYETSLKAFALANQHKMCPVVINRMIDSGIQPSVLSLRHSLLSPDWRNSPSAEQPGFTHAWTLSLAIAREIWSLVLPTRQHIWARKELHGNLGASREMLEGELPVITNDVSSQLIRIAARARDIQFGEQVFAAFDSEINCFGTRYRKDATEGANNNKSGEGAGEQSLDNRNRFPSHMQCDPNVHTYTSMITLYASNADMYGVGKMWNLMLRDGVEPNLHTYTSLVVALHKYALRKRWRHSREHESSKGTDHIAGSAGRNDSDTQPWASTKHDKMIDSIEEWFVNKHDPETTQKPPYQSTADEASGNDDTSSLVNWFKEMASLDLDIPLSTLLLRYHAVRIREAMGRLSFNDYISKSAYSKDSVIKQIQRAMELCQKVESAGLQPDFKFHTALADLFDACGDKPGAELVRRRIEETYKKQQ